MHSFRIIAVLLFLLSFTTNTFAALTGNGSQDTPYIIDEPSDLPELRDIIAKDNSYLYVKQTKDIDLSVLSAATGRPPLPLSANNWSRSALRLPTTNLNSFYGEYDGGGFTVSNWIIKKDKMPNPVATKNYYMSMFGRVGKSGGTKSVIKNLNLDGFDMEMQVSQNGLKVSGFSFLTSEAINTDIVNCHVVNSKVYGIGHFSFGSIAANNVDATITNCSVKHCEFSPTSGAESVGSLCGVNSGDIKDCFAYDVILNGNVYVGGLVGENNAGVLENCGFNGKIGTLGVTFSITNSGGLCGKCSNGTFINCFSAFDNDGKTWKATVFGGLVGIVTEDATIVVKNCYSYPNVKVLENERDNVDFFVGRDAKKESPKRFYESMYCHDNGYGKNFVPYLKDGEDFSSQYKESHKLLVATSDFMRSGCLAEILRDYHIMNLTGKNQWREDVEFMNDTLPVLRFMVNENYDVDPFCHPGIYTMAHTEVGSNSTLNGRLKYITDDQVNEPWGFGIEVKVGNGSWTEVKDIKNTTNGNKIDFSCNYQYSKSKTTVYRAFVSYLPTAQKAYGKIDTICVGTSSSEPEIIEECDSALYEGRWYFPKDNGTIINSAGNEVKINILESKVQYLPLLKGDCGVSSVEIDGKKYDKSGLYFIRTFKSPTVNPTGCITDYQEIKLYPNLGIIDSLKVFKLGEMSYTYSPIGGIDPQTISVGKEYVLTPKELVVDKVKYSDVDCDSIKINVKYVIPIKITNTEDELWSCKPVVYNGKTYTKDTIVIDTIMTPDANVPGGMLYELKRHHIKAAVPDTVVTTKIWCEEIEYECATGICTSTEPRSDTTFVTSLDPNCQCPSKVIIKHDLIGKQPTREEYISWCGPYTYEYKGRTKVWKESGDYVETRSGLNVGACDNDTLVTYHVTIGKSTTFNDTTIHGCGRVVYKNLSGRPVIFEKDTVYKDEISSVTGCSSKRTVFVHIHKVTPQTVNTQGCAPFEFINSKGELTTFDAGKHVVIDTIKTTDACDCDSIIRKTTITVENITTLDLIDVNECNEAIIEGQTYTEDAEFTITKEDPNILKACRTQIQPYKVTINKSVIENYYVDTCGSFTLNGETLTTSGKIEIPLSNGTLCEDKKIYNVRIVEPIKIDSVVYACDNYVYKYFDGHQEMIVDDGYVIVDKISYKVCQCDSIIRTVKVNISHDSYEQLATIKSCGPYLFTKKNGKQIWVEESQIVRDTAVTKFGCHVYSETEVVIIPVKTEILSEDHCKEYHSVVPVWNYNNQPVNVEEIPTSDIRSAELIFLNPNESYPACMDTTKLFLRVHGVGKMPVEQIVECDSFVYEDFKGTKSVITSSVVLYDTLKSTICDCDSIIRTTNITINNSIPESQRQTNALRACDSVIYKNSKGMDMIFKDDVHFLDTFKMKATGCDSVVIVDIRVPKSTGSVHLLTACGDTTLIDSLNDNFPHVFTESGVWRQVLGANAEGCSNYKEWHVEIIPTPRDTMYETGCGELSFRGDTYTSENEKATSFSLTVSGETKCDTTHNYILTVYPKYNHTEIIESCDFVERNGKIYRSSVFFRDTLLSRNNCDSIINVNIVVNRSKNTKDFMFGCNEVKFVDVDYNGGLPIYVHNDTTIYVEKINENGCPYMFVQKIEVGHPTSLTKHIVECFDEEIGYVKFRDLNLTSDTIVYDTVSSDNRCGTIIANIVNLIMPDMTTVHDTMFGCNEVTFVDEDYNGGIPVLVHRDSTINVDKITASGCEYHYAQEIKVGYPSYVDNKKFVCLDPTVGYVSFRDLRLKSDTVIYDTITSDNRCGTIIANIINVVSPEDDDIRDTVFGCDEVVYIDPDFNGGLPIYVHNDTTINVTKTTVDGCAYNLVQDIHIEHPTYIYEDVFECFESEKGFVAFRNLKLLSDTVIIDTVPSSNRCGSVITTNVELTMPVHDTIYIDSCLHITYEGVLFNDSSEVIRKYKTDEMGCDSFVHVMLNVNKCFPYPVLVNKYNWILVCNDEIFDDDTFKVKSNVKYNWYKNNELVSTTNDSYFTEDMELEGCYQVGIIVEGGSEYLSDIVCVNRQMGYSITPQPNPAEKLQAVVIVCDFQEESVIGTEIEVFNMTADRVYYSTATSNDIVIPGMTASGYYLVRLTTTSGKVLTGKYIVK